MKAVRWLRELRARGRADRERERRLLTERLLALIDRLDGRLDEQTSRWAEENAGQTEWELAIEAVRAEVRDGKLDLTADELRELEEIESNRLLNRNFLPPESRRSSPSGRTPESDN